MLGIAEYIRDALKSGESAEALRKELHEGLALLPKRETVRKGSGLSGREKLYVMDMALEIDKGQWRPFYKIGVSRDPERRMLEVANAFSKYTEREVLVTRISVCEPDNPRGVESIMLQLLEPFRAFSTAEFSGATEVFTLFNKRLHKVIHLGDPYALDSCLSDVLRGGKGDSAIFRALAIKDCPDLPNSACCPFGTYP